MKLHTKKTPQQRTAHLAQHASFGVVRFAALLCVTLFSFFIWNNTSYAQQLQNYWQLPVPSQGEASKMPHPLANSLTPNACGACHPKQYNEWRASWHAQAASPGLFGQLQHFDDETAESCLLCHAPRSEQISAWLAQQNEDQDQKANDNALESFKHGVDCATCHVRNHQRYGPNAKKEGPHGEVKALPLFKQSDFCAPCHQFRDDFGQKINGKFLENTHEEWKNSDWGTQNVTCQSCHMPNKSHSFKGIHDAEMTRSAFKVEAIRKQDGVHFKLTNAMTGHAVPTYATPRITVNLVSETAKKIHIIQRQLYLDAEDSLQERADTRLPPKQSLTLFLALKPNETASVHVNVEPDHFYETVIYPYFLEDEDNPSTKRLLEQALNEAKQRHYRLFRINCPTWQAQEHVCRMDNLTE